MDSEQIFANREEEDEVYPDAPGIKKVFINAKVLETGGKEWVYNEGCLSIPKIREDITRAETVTLSYMDENFKSYTETFNGMTARIILHEYDHIDGKLFIDYLKPLRRKILQGKLNDISKGNTKVVYKMIQIK
jgi:peptide deformylase